uniref:Uncharacterized protein n=1 Tax=Gopherus agassizii TaxID=38772 RepID=A0A452GVZ1_9SAUR
NLCPFCCLGCMLCIKYRWGHEDGGSGPSQRTRWCGGAMGGSGPSQRTRWCGGAMGGSGPSQRTRWCGGAMGGSGPSQRTRWCGGAMGGSGPSQRTRWCGGAMGGSGPSQRTRWCGGAMGGSTWVDMVTPPGSPLVEKPASRLSPPSRALRPLLPAARDLRLISHLCAASGLCSPMLCWSIHIYLTKFAEF